MYSTFKSVQGDFTFQIDTLLVFFMLLKFLHLFFYIFLKDKTNIKDIYKTYIIQDHYVNKKFSEIFGRIQVL